MLGEVAASVLESMVALHQSSWTPPLQRRTGVWVLADRSSAFVAQSVIFLVARKGRRPQPGVPKRPSASARAHLYGSSFGPRSMPAIDRRCFVSERVYDILQHRCTVVCCSDEGAARTQLEAVTVSARGLARGLACARQFRPFLSGTAAARDRARLTIRAGRKWLSGEAWHLRPQQSRSKLVPPPPPRSLDRGAASGAASAVGNARAHVASASTASASTA